MGTKVFVETIYRGENQGVKKLDAFWKSDYRLIHKTEEQLWLQRLAECPPRPKTFVSQYMDLPPLFAHFEKLNNPDASLKMKRFANIERVGCSVVIDEDSKVSSSDVVT